MNILLLTLLAIGQNANIDDLKNDDYLIRRNTVNLIVNEGLPTIQKLKTIKTTDFDLQTTIQYTIDQYYAPEYAKISIWYLPKNVRYKQNENDQQIDVAKKYYLEALKDFKEKDVEPYYFFYPDVELKATQLFMHDLLEKNQRKEAIEIIIQMCHSYEYFISILPKYYSDLQWHNVQYILGFDTRSAPNTVEEIIIQRFKDGYIF